MSVLTAPEIILRPVISEKSIDESGRGKYTFAVHDDANKSQIKQAVEKLYEVKVRDVRTQTRKGKPRRTRTGYAKTSDWKRAVVVLGENSRIELF